MSNKISCLHLLVDLLLKHVCRHTTLKITENINIKLTYLSTSTKILSFNDNCETHKQTEKCMTIVTVSRPVRSKLTTKEPFLLVS